MQTAKILDFRQALAQRQEAVRVRRYTKIARKIAVRPSLWLLGAILITGGFWICAYELWRWTVSV